MLGAWPASAARRSHRHASAPSGSPSSVPSPSSKHAAKFAMASGCPCSAARRAHANAWASDRASPPRPSLYATLRLYWARASPLAPPVPTSAPDLAIPSAALSCHSLTASTSSGSPSGLACPKWCSRPNRHRECLWPAAADPSSCSTDSRAARSSSSAKASHAVSSRAARRSRTKSRRAAASKRWSGPSGIRGWHTGHTTASGSTPYASRPSTHSRW
mmetsp:Transcript_37643/g.84115  ORF Transcript_37643/g.84115 Transcript_37643/m.84115 type:complete len:217 (-) Transcript_37643:469-1119(-)